MQTHEPQASSEHPPAYRVGLGQLRDVGRSLLTHQRRLCFAASSRDKMSMVHSSFLSILGVGHRAYHPQRKNSGRLPCSRSSLLTALSPLFLLQSPCARKVHQVSIWAVPPLPPSSASALCLKVIPAASPPSVTCILGGRQVPLGSPSTPVQAHPGVSPSR